MSSNYTALKLKAPFPYFGGKSRVSHIVWPRFGSDVCNYVEPFAGSLATLLLRPGGPGKNETVNDKDAYIANFWRAIHSHPEEVAFYADSPVNECDLHARHKWLVDQKDFRQLLDCDPDYCSPKIAGWWVWGISLWIGSGWCVHPEWTGRSAVAAPHGRGIQRNRLMSFERKKRPVLKAGGGGVHRAAFAAEPWRQKPNISGDSGASGRGVHLGSAQNNLYRYFDALATRLRRVRVCCGEWDRILRPSSTTQIGTTAVFLDPPYDLRIGKSKAGGSDGGAPTYKLYGFHNHDLSAAVRQWAVEHGDNPLLRIALCGYADEHDMPDTWTTVEWKANGGYGNQGKTINGNRHKERIWFSPHCLKLGLFEQEEDIAI